MVVRIRLSRWGARKNPFYGIVIANHRAARDGKTIERVGNYNPVPDAQGIKNLELNADRIKYWLGVGAQPSDKVSWLLAKANLMPPQPHQLAHQGLFSLNDPKTWDVRIRDENGTVLADLSSDTARARYDRHPDFQNLPGDLPTPVFSRVTYENIKLDGVPPTAPLTPAEALKVLKEVAGLR
ncbi:ribosomal protein S16 domain-containing protein [Polychytrium aggregatum]|uniref:ribosomal protein S16 domain-containing protein n=1 Tax=Polychytrium aggregatum TaxID=110093 RepID=UPI0022FE8CAE|nr:ribosomal protein S16 domain-containing protein [Polychytrium aggregatum]KAI9205364.1 ribosomal protein S16 domain-containing protein [Polychytrium aggregatum]